MDEVETALPRAQRKTVFLLECAEPEMGMERVALRLIRALTTRELIAVTVLAGPAPQLSGVECRSLGAQPRRFRRVVRIWRTLRFAATCRANRVIVVGAWVAAPWLTVASRRRQTIVWEHSLLREKWALTRKLMLLNLWAACVYWRAESVVTVSRPLTRDVARFVPEAKVRLIPNLIGQDPDPDMADVKAPRGRPIGRLIMVGNLSRLKNQQLLINALPQLPTSWTVQLVGDGPARHELEASVADLGLSARVEFLGYRTHEETLELIREADVLVHPSLSETFGLAYFEAAQVGTPVVAYRNRVADWLIPTYVPGVTVNGSGEQLAAAIEHTVLGTDADGAAAAATAAGNRQRDFAADVIISDWENLLSSAPEERHVP